MYGKYKTCFNAQFVSTGIGKHIFEGRKEIVGRAVVALQGCDLTELRKVCALGIQMKISRKAENLL